MICVRSKRIDSAFPVRIAEDDKLIRHPAPLRLLQSEAAKQRIAGAVEFIDANEPEFECRLIEIEPGSGLVFGNAR